MTAVERDGLDPTEYVGLREEPAEEELADEEETRALGRWLASQVESGDFVGLVGDLGAGKTTLMQGLVAELKGDGEEGASSPTYSLIQIYDTNPPVFHMDLYRLQGWDDLESIGYWDYLEGGEGVSCVEWLDRIPGAWPGRGLIIELRRRGAGRMARIWHSEDMADRIVEL